MKKFILVPTPDGTDQLIKVSRISRVIQEDQDYGIIMKGGDVIFISISPTEVLGLIQGERLDPQRSAELKAKQMGADMVEDLEEPKLSRGEALMSLWSTTESWQAKRISL